MAVVTLITQFRTALVPITTPDSVVTRRFTKMRNLGANIVSIGEVNTISGPVTAGAQTSLNPVPATGVPDEILLAPGRTYFMVANVAAVLCSFEEVPGRVQDFGRDP